MFQTISFLKRTLKVKQLWICQPLQIYYKLLDPEQTGLLDSNHLIKHVIRNDVLVIFLLIK